MSTIERTDDEYREGGRALRRYRRALVGDPITLIAVLILVVLFVSAFAAELVAPYDPVKQQLAMRNRPPLTPALLEAASRISSAPTSSGVTF